MEQYSPESAWMLAGVIVAVLTGIGKKLGWVPAIGREADHGLVSARGHVVRRCRASRRVWVVGRAGCRRG